jgi:hypothetical protein
MQIPLPKTIRGSQVLPKQSEYLVNLMNLGGWLVSRPAVVEVTAKADEPRGMFRFQGTLYGIWGDQLYKDAALNLVGAIGGVGQTRHARGFNHAVIVTGTAGANYTVSPASGLTAIVDADLPACVDASHIKGRFVYIPEDGGPALWSEIGDGGDIDSLSFFDAESQPDENRASEVLGDVLYLMGADTIEPFRAVGPVTAPFLPVDGGTIEVGYVGGKIGSKTGEVDSCIFLGRPKDGGYRFLQFADGRAVPISTPAIDELLQDYTEVQLQAVRAQRFAFRGVDCYTFELPDRTLIYHDGLWDYVAAGVGFRQLARWLQFSATFHEDTWYTQSAKGLNKLTKAGQDTTGKFARQIITFARSTEQEPLEFGELELAINNGVGAGTVGVSVSRNGQIWSDPYYRDRSAVGVHDAPLIWNPAGGFGSFERGFAGIGFYTTDDVEFAVDGLVAR